MIILGIDPGSRKTGYAFLKVEGKAITYLSSGVLCFEKIENFLDRVNPIYNEVKKIFDEHYPDEISMESLIYVKSPTALIKLAQTRGVILSAISATHSGKIYEYSPNLVKSSTVGHGHADKENVQKFLNMILGERIYRSSDESDAVAIALCHILNRNQKIMDNKSNSEKSTGKSKSRSLKSVFAHLA